MLGDFAPIAPLALDAMLLKIESGLVRMHFAEHDHMISTMTGDTIKVSIEYRSGSPMPKKTERPPADLASHPDFVARLRGLVDEAGGQRSFAARAGVSQGTVNLWLRDSEPGRDKLAAIAKATGVSLDWLVSGCGPSVGMPAWVYRDAIRRPDRDEGHPDRPFFATDKFIFLPLSLFGY